MSVIVFVPMMYYFQIKQIKKVLVQFVAQLHCPTAFGIDYDK